MDLECSNVECLDATPPNGPTPPNGLDVSATMAALYQKLADQSAAAERNAHLRNANDWYRRSLAAWQEVKSSGLLSPRDRAKPDEVAGQIASTEAALRP